MKDQRYSSYLDLWLSNSNEETKAFDIVSRSEVEEAKTHLLKGHTAPPINFCIL